MFATLIPFAIIATLLIGAYLIVGKLRDKQMNKTIESVKHLQITK